MYGEEIYNIHYGTSGANSEGQQEWKSSNRQNDGILSREQDGKGISNKSTDSTKRQFSLKSVCFGRWEIDKFLLLNFAIKKDRRNFFYLGALFHTHTTIHYC